MRRFIKTWCMSFGVVAGMYLTIFGHPYDGLYVLLLGVVLTVLEIQDLERLRESERKKEVLVDIMREQFGVDKSLEMIDEHFVRKGYVSQETVDKDNAERKAKS